ncbi:hypothetical protein FACS189434_09400 [Bacteroidia bacterium]|nr:hypothetical protein FACS189434_09400 [Bacteroidia bacterium]
MAENFEKKVLVAVEVKAKEALKQYADLKTKVDEFRATQENLKKQMKDVDTSTDEGAQRLVNLRQEYEFVGQQIKAYNTEAQNYQKEIQSNIRYQAEQEGSLQKLKAELSLNTTAFNKLSEAERNSLKGQMLSKQIDETTAKLKEEEEALGNHRRSVGDYAKAGQSLKSEMKELVNTLAQMKVAGEDNSATYKEMNARLAELKDAYADVQAEAGAMASDTNKLDALQQSMSLLAGSVAAVGASMGVSANGASEYEEAMRKMQVVILATTSFIQFQQALQKESIVRQYASIIAEKAKLAIQILSNKEGVRAAVVASAQAKAETAKNAALGKGSIITKTAAAVQWLWNAALAANPVMAIVLAITLLIAGIGLLIAWFVKSNDAAETAEKANKAYEMQAQKTADTIAAIDRRTNNAMNERKNASREEILELKKNGATAEQIAAARAKAEQDLRDIQIKAAKDKLKTDLDEMKSLTENLKAARALRDSYKEGTKDYAEQMEVINELVRKKNALNQTMKDEIQAQKELNIQSAEDKQAQSEEKKKKYQDAAMKNLEAQRKLQEENYKQTDLINRKEFADQQKYDAEKFAATQKYEADKLKMQRRFNQITAEEFKAGNDLLAEQQQTFAQQSLSALNKYQAEKQKELIALINEDVDLQIKELERKYSEAAKAFEMPAPKRLEGQSDTDYENSDDYRKYQDFQLKKANYELQLETELAEKVTALRESNLAAQIEKANKILEKGNAEELAKFQDNEGKKLDIEIAALKQRAAKAAEITEKDYLDRRNEILKSAKLLASDEGALDEETRKKVEALDEDYRKRKAIADANAAAEERKLGLQNSVLQLNVDLLNANKNAEAIYKAKKDALERELALYEGNAEKQLEVQQKLAENEQELIDRRIEDFGKYTSAISEAMGAMSELSSQIEAGQIQEYEESNEKKKASLQKRLDKGLISQEEYDKEVAAADKELDAKKAEIARKQAIREKAMKTFSVITSTIQSIAESAKMGFPAAIPFIVMAAALGAIQTAAIIAQPLPKASKGMLLHGASHAQGGIPIEAEGGEVIINKRSTAMFKPLLSAINEAGGGVKFAAGGVIGGYAFNDGGYNARSLQNNIVTADEIKEAFTDALGELKVFTALEDLHQADQNYTDIQNYREN